jgi:hypothetical protein
LKHSAKFDGNYSGTLKEVCQAVIFSDFPGEISVSINPVRGARFRDRYLAFFPSIARTIGGVRVLVCIQHILLSNLAGLGYGKLAVVAIQM